MSSIRLGKTPERTACARMAAAGEAAPTIVPAKRVGAGQHRVTDRPP